MGEYRPVQYEEDVIHFENNQYKKVDIGYGKKWTYKVDKESETSPGPIYTTEYLKSI